MRKAMLILGMLVLFQTGHAKTNGRGVVATCFSQSAFDKVYAYLSNRLTVENVSKVTYGEYTLFPDEASIAFCKKDWTLAEISRDKGIVGLPLRYRDKIKAEKNCSRIFCELLAKS